MKRLYLSIGLIALLAVLSGLHIWQLNRVTGQLTGLLTEAQDLVEREDWVIDTKLMPTMHIVKITDKNFLVFIK